jgi:hypothetical protein
MSKSKDRLMLEKILNNAADSGVYYQLCDDGKTVIKDLAKYLNKPLSYVCGDPVEKSLQIYTDTFEIPDLFEDDDDEAEDVVSVEVIVKRNGKSFNIPVDSYSWW